MAVKEAIYTEARTFLDSCDSISIARQVLENWGCCSASVRISARSCRSFLGVWLVLGIVGKVCWCSRCSVNDWKAALLSVRIRWSAMASHGMVQSSPRSYALACSSRNLCYDMIAKRPGELVLSAIFTCRSRAFGQGARYLSRIRVIVAKFVNFKDSLYGYCSSPLQPCRMLQRFHQLSSPITPTTNMEIKPIPNAHELSVAHGGLFGQLVLDPEFVDLVKSNDADAEGPPLELACGEKGVIVGASSGYVLVTGTTVEQNNVS